MPDPKDTCPILILLDYDSHFLDYVRLFFLLFLSSLLWGLPFLLLAPPQILMTFKANYWLQLWLIYYLLNSYLQPDIPPDFYTQMPNTPILLEDSHRNLKFYPKIKSIIPTYHSAISHSCPPFLPQKTESAPAGFSYFNKWYHSL